MNVKKGIYKLIYKRKIDCPIEGCNEKIKWIDLDSHISNKNHILLL